MTTTNLHTINSDGTELAEGDKITDFRGDTATFIRATRVTTEGRSGKVLVQYDSDPGGDSAHQEYYDKVFGLRVVEEI